MLGKNIYRNSTRCRKLPARTIWFVCFVSFHFFVHAIVCFFGAQNCVATACWTGCEVFWRSWSNKENQYERNYLNVVRFCQRIWSIRSKRGRNQQQQQKIEINMWFGLKVFGCIIFTVHIPHTDCAQCNGSINLPSANLILFFWLLKSFKLPKASNIFTFFCYWILFVHYLKP